MPYCASGEEHAPYGIAVRMGDSYFRTCDIWTDGAFRQFILRVNPEAFPALNFERSASSIRVVARNRRNIPFQKTKRSLPEVGSYEFGGLRYSSFGSEQKGKNGRSNRVVFQYNPVVGSHIPLHSVDCFGWSNVGFDDSLNCTVEVDVGDAVASQLYLGGFENDLSFSERFPLIAQDLARILDAADITEEVKNREVSIDVID